MSPGWIHDALAALTLQVLQGNKVNVGDVTDDFVKSIPGSEDSPEPAVLLARIYAHLAHRLPIIRKIAKRFEGREPRAGLGSDVLAFSAQLYLRNRDLVGAFRTVLRDRATAARENAQNNTRKEGAE